MERFGIVGEKLSHTLSPIIQKEFGLDYGVFEVKKDEFENFVFNNNLVGYNVTMPYKQMILPLLSEIDPIAKTVGAVNTVVNISGRRLGYNTDVGGMIYALNNAEINLKNKNVAILGTGGTSNTAYYVAKLLGASSIYKVGRTAEINYNNFNLQKNVNVIINTTPVGMFPFVFSSIINPNKVDGLEAVFDAVYNPLKTNLTINCPIGVKTANGLSMLVEQARLAHNLFVDNISNSNLIAEAQTKKVVNILYKNKINIVLIGMPSCGKTTVGKLVAKALNKRFVDIDLYIENKVGMSPNNIIENKGESEFRKIESEAVKELACYQGLVIATGGGTICNKDNAKILGLNGKFFYIMRDIAKLSIDNRPVSKVNGIEPLFALRKGEYEKVADFTIENVVIEDVVKEIINYYENISY